MHSTKLVIQHVTQVTHVNTVAQLLANNAAAASAYCYMHINNKQLMLVSACEQYANVLQFNTNKSMCKALNALAKTHFTCNEYLLCTSTYNSNKQVYNFAQKHACELA
jgi:hypothetical protein